MSKKKNFFVHINQLCPCSYKNSLDFIWLHLKNNCFCCCEYMKSCYCSVAHGGSRCVYSTTMDHKGNLKVMPTRRFVDSLPWAGLLWMSISTVGVDQWQWWRVSAGESFVLLSDQWVEEGRWKHWPKDRNHQSVIVTSAICLLDSFVDSERRL